MAVSVEAAFVLLDKASGPLKKIRDEAALTDKALRDMGGGSSGASGWTRQYKAVTTGIASIGQATSDLSDKTKQAGKDMDEAARKAETFSTNTRRHFGRLRTATEAVASAASRMVGVFKGPVEAVLTRGKRLLGDFFSALQPIAPALKGIAGVGGVVVGAISGLASALPPLVWAALLATPAILALAGAITALVGSLTAAVGGAFVLGGGLLGSFAVGVGSIVAVAKPAITQLKAYETQQKALNKAIATGNKADIAKQAKLLDQMAKAHPGVSKLADSLHGLSQQWDKLTAPGRKSFFQLLADGIDALKKDMPTFAHVVNQNLGAVATDFHRILQPFLQSSAFQDFIKRLGDIFRANLPGMMRGLVSLFGALSNMLKVAEPTLKRFGDSFARLMDRFANFTGSPRGRQFVEGMINAFKAWMGLIGGVLKLFLALAGASGPGTSLIQHLANTVNTFANKLMSPGGQAQLTHWFNTSIGKAGDLASTIGNIGTAFMNFFPVLNSLGIALGSVLKVIPSGLLTTLAGAYLAVKTVTGIKGTMSTLFGGKGGGLLGKLFGVKGQTPANPLYTWLVNGGGGLPGTPGKDVKRVEKKGAQSALDKVLHPIEQVAKPAAGAAGAFLLNTAKSKGAAVLDVARAIGPKALGLAGALYTVQTLLPSTPGTPISSPSSQGGGPVPNLLRHGLGLLSGLGSDPNGTAAGIASTLGLSRSASAGLQSQVNRAFSLDRGRGGGPGGAITGQLNGLASFIKSADDQVQKLTGSRNVKGLQQLADRARAFANQFPAAAPQLNHFANQIGQLLRQLQSQTGSLLAKTASDFPQVAAAMDRTQGDISKKSAAAVKALQGIIKNGTGPMRQLAKADLDALVNSTDTSMGGMLKIVSQTTGQAFKVGSTNFNDLAANIASYIGSGAEATNKGLQNITDQVNAALTQFGNKQKLAPAQIKALSASQLAGLVTGAISPGAVADVGGGNPGHATGGMVRTPMYMVGEEAPRHPEYVLATNPSYRRRNLGLWAQAGRELGVPGFAQGGNVGAALAGVGAAVRGAGGYVFPFGGSSWAWSRTDQGVDFGGSGPIGAIGNFRVTYSNPSDGWYPPAPAFMVYQLTNGADRGRYVYIAEHLASMAPQGSTGRAGQAIAQMTGGIEMGWAAGPSGHQILMPMGANHLTAAGQSFHDFLLGLTHGVITGGAFGSAAAVPTVRVPRVTGTGPMSRVAQGALNRAGRGANAFLARTISPGLNLGSATGPPAAGNIMGIAHWAANQAGVPWNAAIIQTLLSKESGGGQNLPASGPLSATGPFQVIPGTFASYDPGGNINNPRDNALAAMRYIKSRYGTLEHLASVTGLLGSGYHGYKTGGRIPWFGGGGDFIAHRPQLIGVGDGPRPERVTITPQGAGGHGVHIGHMVIQNHRPGDVREQIKREVAQAFNDLSRELDGLSMEDSDQVMVP